MVNFNTVILNKGKVSNFWFTLEAIEQPVTISAGGKTFSSKQDRVLETESSESSGSAFYVIPKITHGLEQSAISFSFSSSNESVATVAQDGFVTPISPGQVLITVTGAHGNATVSNAINLTVQIDSDVGVIKTVGGVLGSLRKALTDYFDNEIATNNAAAGQNLYSQQDHENSNYTRNQNFFLNSHLPKLSAISPYNSLGQNTRGGTLITSRHVVVATHYSITVGSTIRFVEASGVALEQSHDYTVIAKYQIPQPFLYSDATILLLDSEVSSNLEPVKIVPSNIIEYLPDDLPISRQCGDELPIFALDQQEKGLVFNGLSIANPTKQWFDSRWKRPSEPNRVEFWEESISGDSGNPLFLVSSSDIFLLSTFYSQAHGPRYGGFDLNAAIDAVDEIAISQGYLNEKTNKTITEGDFSIFPNFSTGNYIVEDSGSSNASLWVESGTVNGKESYTMRESASDYWTLAWDGDSWEFTATGSPTSSFSDSASDGTTPDLATFSTLNFSNP
jgi:hypothetical protein